MAKATSREDCNARHIQYQFDVWEGMNSLQKLRLEKMMSFIKEGSRVLDIGCNSGYVKYLTTNCDCYGVDVAPALVEKAKKLINAQVADAEDLPFEDNFFDVSILGEILEHVYDADAVLKESVRVTKALIVGSTPHEQSNWGHNGMHCVEDHKHHVRCYTKNSLTDLLSKYGKPTIDIVRHNKKNQMYVFTISLGV